MKSILALAVSDLKITFRRGEALILNLLVPIAVLVALANTSTGITRAMPFVYLQAVLATSMVSLGITTGFDRRFRVLVRLGTTPLGRRGLIYSKIVSLIVLQAIQLLILSLVGVFLGWQPDPKWLLAIPLCWFASCAFAGIALLIAGNVKAEANLGLQNLLYLFMIGIGSIGFADNSRVPDSVHTIVTIFPSGALHSLLRYLGGIGNFSPVALISIILCSLALPLIAAKKFSFDE